MVKKEKAEKTDKTDETAGSTMKAAEAAVRKKFGEGAAVYLSSKMKQEVHPIPTGSLGLDLALGIGGLPLGRMVEVFGTPSAGKTTLAISVAANALKHTDRKILYVDAEHALNGPLAVKMGLDIDRTLVIETESAETSVEAAQIYMKTGEFAVTIIDSVASLTPQAQVDATLEDQFMGLHARLMSRMCPIIKTICGQTNTLLVLINQIRFKVGSYGNPEVTTGGNAIPFYSDVRIRVSGGESKNSRIINEDGEVVGHKNVFEVVKNKLAVPFKKAEVNLIYGVGYDEVAELVDLGEQMGLVDVAGSWVSYETMKAQGKDRFAEELRKNDEFRNKLKSEITKVFNGS